MVICHRRDRRIRQNDGPLNFESVRQEEFAANCGSFQQEGGAVSISKLAATTVQIAIDLGANQPNRARRLEWDRSSPEQDVSADLNSIRPNGNAVLAQEPALFTCDRA